MYKCGECSKNIGLMADRKGLPEMYKCPYTGQVTGPQEPLPKRKAVLRKRSTEDELSR